MIGKLKGTLIELEGNLGLIETTIGLSYYVFLTPPLINKYKLQEKIEIYTYLQVKEDGWVLFGFDEKQEYKLFKTLLSVSGVGPKTAFSVISFSRPQELIDAVRNNEVEYLTRIPHLGKKTAMKIILELSSKLETEFKFVNLYLTDEDQTVVEALVSLGYKTQEAKDVLSKLPKDLSVEEKIKEALKLTASAKK